MRLLFFVVLGVALSTTLAAQPVQVWQRQFGDVPLTRVSVSHIRKLQSGNLVGVGYSAKRNGSIYSNKATFWLFNGQGDTISSRDYALTNGYYQQVLPLTGGDFLLTGAADSAVATVPGTFTLRSCLS